MPLKTGKINVLRMEKGDKIIIMYCRGRTVKIRVYDCNEEQYDQPFVGHSL